MKKLVLLAISLLAVTVLVAADETLFRYNGFLQYGDAQTLDGGFMDQFAVEVEPGVKVSVLAVSVDFTPALEIAGPANSESASGVVTGPGSVYYEGEADESGYLTVRIASTPLETGEYTVRVFTVPEAIVSAESGI
jgi:hypothetical protein